MRRDVARTLLVVAEQPQLWAAIKDRLDPELALVRNARPAQLAEVWRRADPWPWIVVGAARSVPDGLGELVAGKPIPVLWLGEPDGSLPRGAVVHRAWGDLACELDRLRSACVFGLEFAPRRGVRAGPLGNIGPAAELEGLMAAHPRGLPRFETLHRARRAIRRHDLPCQVEVSAELVRLGGRTRA